MLTEEQKQETMRVLRQHMRRYPAMEPTDAVKLLYQNEFAGGHLIADEAGCVERLRQECEEVPAEAREAEPLGNGVVRLHLSGVNYQRMALNSVARCFIATAKLHRGDRNTFYEKLVLLERLAAAGETPFDETSLENYLQEYRASGCPPVSHSPAFREQYQPSYRVIGEGYLRLLPLVQAVDTLRAEQKTVVLALDGRCAAGKTTAAALLSALWDAPVVHMDDFFLPPALRTPERFAQPGGNVHYERFLKEVIPGLKAHTSFEYQTFDCSSLRYSGRVSIAPSSVTIVEGAYSLHPSFGKYADITVFFDVEPEEQMRRIEKRNGGEMAKMFRERWIPLEEQYLAEFGLTQKVDYRIA